MKPALPLLRTGILLAAAISAPATAATNSISWTGATDIDWSVGTNWSGGVAPADDLTTDLAVFNQTTYLNQPDVGIVPRSVAGIVIGDGTTATSPLTILGDMLTLGADGIDMKASAGETVLDSALTLGAAQTWRNDSANPLSVDNSMGGAGNIANGGLLLTIDGSGPVSLGRAITGTGGVTKNGTGTLTLAAAHAYTGATTVNAGTLEIGDGASGTLGSAITNNATLKYNSSGNMTLGGVISGTGALVKEGTGMLTVTAGNTYSGTTTINDGTLRLLRGTTYANTPGFTVNIGGTLDIDTNNNTWTTPSKPVSLNGGTMSMTATGYQGKYGLFTGLVTVGSASTIQLNVANAPGAAPNASNFFLDGGITGSSPLTVEAGSVGKVGLVLRNSSCVYSGPITVNGLASTTAASASGLALGVTAGSPNLTQADLEINGTLEIGNQGMGWASSVTATGAAAVAIDALSGTGVVTSNGATRTLTIGNNDGGADFSGQLANGTAASSVLSLIKNGAGTQILSGENTFTGTTTVNAGILRLAHQNALQNSVLVPGAGTVEFDDSVVANEFTVGGLSGAGNFVLQNEAAAPMALTLGNTSATHTGNLSGSGSLVKAGNGVQTLSGTNTYAGQTIIDSGVLSFAKASAFYNSTTGAVSAATVNNLVVNSGGCAAFGVGGTDDFLIADLQTLLNASTASVGFLPGAFIGIDTTGATGAAYTLGTALPDANGGANATGLMKIGTGALTLTTAGTYTGTTAVAQASGGSIGANALILSNGSGVSVPGNLQVGNDGAGAAVVHLGAAEQVADSGVLSFVGTTGNWGYFKMLGFNETVAGLSSAANGVIENMEAEVVNSNVTLTVNNSADHSYTGYIRNKQSGAGTGTLALTKEGTGTQTLVGANITYSGATTVNAGKLVLQDTTGFLSPITNNTTVELTGAPSLKGAISGAGTINKTGTGVARFNGASQAITATGQINVENGALQNDGNSVNWSGCTANVDIAGTAILDLFADAIYVNQLTGTGVVQSSFGNNAGSQSGSAAFIEKLVVGTGNGSSTFDGVIRNNATNAALGSGAGKGGLDLVKTGSGTFTLTGTSNTYTGTTTVNAGTLLINGTKSGTGAVTVASTGTLGGTGNVAGAVTIQSGGTLAPGTSAGTMGFPTSVEVQSGATYAAEIASASSFDRIVTSGSLTVNGTIKVTLLGGYTPAANTVFDLADATTISGTPTFDFTAATLPAGMGWDTTAFATNGTIQVVGTSDPFNAWATTNNVTGGKSGDDDNDGVTNLLEFATAADPKSGGSGARAYPLVHAVGGQKVLTYTIAVRAGASFAANGSKQRADKDGVRYEVEGSDQLGTWDTVVVSELPPADATAVQAALGTKLNGLDAAWQWRSFRTDGDMASDAADFIRLNVTEAP